jgi:hypothetical protein
MQGFLIIFFFTHLKVQVVVFLFSFRVSFRVSLRCHVGFGLSCGFWFQTIFFWSVAWASLGSCRVSFKIRLAFHI